MTSLVIERFGDPSIRREVRVARFERGRALDDLGGRTVWCASALPHGRARSRRLQASLRWTHDGGVVTRELNVTGPGALLDVRPGDVVVFHDAVSATMAEAVRDRGAHALCHVQPRLARGRVAAADAYLVTWRREIAALMPSPDLLAAKEIAERADADLAWGVLIADVVEDDRGERVGGTRHVRPVVAAH